MTEQELDVLERIWKGQTTWAPEVEPVLDHLASEGLIEIIEKHQGNSSGQQEIDSIFVRITDEGSAHLSSSGY